MKLRWLSLLVQCASVALPPHTLERRTRVRALGHQHCLGKVVLGTGELDEIVHVAVPHGRVAIAVDPLSRNKKHIAVAATTVQKEQIRLPWSNIIVVYAGTSWDGPPASEKQLTIALSPYIPVLYVDPGQSIIREWRTGRGLGRSSSDVTIVQPNVARLRTLVPPGVSRPGLRHVAAAMTCRAVNRWLKDVGVTPQATLFARLLPVASRRVSGTRVLYGTDDFVAGASLMGLSTRWVEKLEHQHLTRADLVLAVTPELASKWRAAASNIVVFPNGCNVDAFANTDSTPAAQDVRLRSPIAGFLGHISERIDISLLRAVADRGVSLLLVGPTTRNAPLAGFDELVALPNVHWVGPKLFEQLPSYMKTIDVGLTPYGDSDFNRASFPLKTLEYLAAGRPVVSTPLPASRSLGGDVVLAGTPEAFADAVSKVLAAPGDERAKVKRRALAMQNSWNKRALDLIRLIGL